MAIRKSTEKASCNSTLYDMPHLCRVSLYMELASYLGPCAGKLGYANTQEYKLCTCINAAFIRLPPVLRSLTFMSVYTLSARRDLGP